MPAQPTERVDPLAPMPPYRQIAAIIKRRILAGQYPPNTRIPTESELVETEKVIRAQLFEALMTAQYFKARYDLVAIGSQISLTVGKEIAGLVSSKP